MKVKGANQVLEECVFPESQRDSATKPRVARHELPELPRGNESGKQNPKEVSALVNVRRWSQPRWACCFSRLLPRVARASQPWALGRNPFGIGRVRKSDFRIKTNRAPKDQCRIQGVKNFELWAVSFVICHLLWALVFLITVPLSAADLTPEG